MGKTETRAESLKSADNVIIGATTPDGKEIMLDLNAERQKWQAFYENHNFKDKIDIPEIHLTPEQIKEIQSLIEQGYVDSCAIIADHLTYGEMESAMAEIHQDNAQNNFKGESQFDKLDKLESTTRQQYRIIFYRKVQDLEDDKILRETSGKSPEPKLGEQDNSIDAYLKEKNRKFGTNIEGMSLKDYLIVQREFTETTNTNQGVQDKSRHMDENGWTWCLKSKIKFEGSDYIVRAGWDPDGRNWLYVGALVSSFPLSFSSGGSRLSRSFEIK